MSKVWSALNSQHLSDCMRFRKRGTARNSPGSPDKLDLLEITISPAIVTLQLEAERGLTFLSGLVSPKRPNSAETAAGPRGVCRKPQWRCCREENLQSGFAKPKQGAEKVKFLIFSATARWRLQAGQRQDHQGDIQGLRDHEDGHFCKQVE